MLNDIEDIRQIRELYELSFPDDEKEAFDNILLRQYMEYPHTVILFDKVDGNIRGFNIGDYYADSHTALLSYCAIKKEYRCLGIGYALTFQLAEQMRQLGARHIFFEVENPKHINEPFSYTRLELFQKWGCKIIPIHHIMPPLGKGKRPLENLLLLSLYGENITELDLILFYISYYREIGYLYHGDYFMHMVMNILKTYNNFHLRFDTNKVRKAYQITKNRLDNTDSLSLENAKILKALGATDNQTAMATNLPIIRIQNI